MALAFPVAPMKATMGSLPADGDDQRWAFEIKWDGHRTLAHVEAGRVRFQSSGGGDVSERWADVAGLATATVGGPAILDGEMLVIGEDGRPSFDLVQRRDPTRHRAVFHVFDVLRIGEHDTVTLPYADRRRLLGEILDDGDHWRVPAARIGDGEALLAATADQGLEGVIAKRVDSRYVPGSRSKDWIKVKNRRTVTVPIGGFTAGSGNRSTTFGSLLVGHPDSPDGGPLAFAGGVGTGFSQAVLEELAAVLRPLSTDVCPFDPPPAPAVRRTATWVRPALHATVEIAEFTNEGHVRHASFVGLAP